MQKLRVGILTFSDGREYIHREMLETNNQYQVGLKKALESTGEVDVVAGESIIDSSETARREGMRLKESSVDLTICNYAI